MHRKRTAATFVLAAAAALVLIPVVSAADVHHGRAGSSIGFALGAGSLDKTFGQSGFTVVPQQVYSVNDVRVDRNGDIIVAVDFAGLGDAIGGFGIARLLANGSLDSGFGSGGIAVAQFSSGFNVAMSTSTQIDGKIVAVGASRSLPSGVTVPAIARFTATGALDQQFGSGGRVSPAIPGASQSAAATVMSLSSGKILVGGSAAFPTGAVGILMRLHSDGSLDPSFGNAGIVNTGLPGLNGLGLQSDGKIVALGGSEAARFLANGTLDSHQARGTLVAESHMGTSELTTDERIVAVFALPDNGSGSDVDTQAMRFFPNGAVDNKFHSPLFDYVVTNPDIFQNEGHAVAIQSNGAIVVGGGGQPSNAVFEFGLARLLASGRFDSSFGHHGIVVNRLAGNCAIGALGLQPDGDILAAGQEFDNTDGFVVARYLP